VYQFDAHGFELDAITRAHGDGVVGRGPCTRTEMGAPFLKKPIVAYMVAGG